MIYLNISQSSSYSQRISFGNSMYDDFVNSFNKAYPNSSMSSVCRQIIQNNKELNHGNNKRVYNIPQMPDYLIGYLYKKKPLDEELPIHEIPNKLPKYNFGQEIAGNGYDLIVMKRINGITAGCPIEMIKSMHEKDKATPEIAQEYLSKLKLIKDFPQEAFDDLAEQVKYILDNNKFFDFLNPNNLLIDTEKKQLHIIDLFSDYTNNRLTQYLEQRDCSKPGLHELLCLLLDSRHQFDYLSQMNQNDKREVIVITYKILKKCLKACEKTNLSHSDDSIDAILCYFSEKFSQSVIERKYGDSWMLIQDLSDGLV